MTGMVEGLPAGSIAVCELSSDRVDPVILESIRSARFNLVVYNSPYDEPYLPVVRYAQDPQEHIDLISRQSSAPRLPEIYMPRAARSSLSPADFEALKRHHNVFHSAYRDSTTAGDDSRASVYYIGVANIGGIIRVELSEAYYFVPGRDLEEQSKNLAGVYSGEVIPRRTAYLVSSATVCRPSLFMILPRWDSTVLALMLSRVAISLVVRPSTMS